MTYTPRTVVALCEMALEILAETEHFNTRFIGGKAFYDQINCARMLALFVMNASPSATMELDDTCAIAIQTVISFSATAPKP